MALRISRFLGLLTTALALGLTLAHVLESPGKQALNGPEWLRVQQTFYGGFGLVGGVSETLALVSTVVVLVLVRGRRLAFTCTLIAAGCLVGMFAVFLFGNNPVNGQIAVWTPATMPANWRELRDRWETAHATSFVLALVAFVTLLVATLADMVPLTHVVAPVPSPHVAVRGR